MPTEVRSSTSRRSSTGMSTNSRIHWTESFIFLNCGLQLVGHRRSDVLYKASLHGSVDFEIAASITQAQSTIWPSTNLIGIIILPVILPKANRTNFKSTTRVQCPVLTAGASKRLLGLPWFRDALESTHAYAYDHSLANDERRTTRDVLTQTAPKTLRHSRTAAEYHPVHTSMRTADPIQARTRNR